MQHLQFACCFASLPAAFKAVFVTEEASKNKKTHKGACCLIRKQPPQQQAGLAGPWAGWAGGKRVLARGVPASRSPGRWGAVGETWGLAAGFPCPYAPGYGNVDMRAL